MNINRPAFIVISFVLFASVASAQSKVESFTTEYYPEYGLWGHQTAYEFEVPYLDIQGDPIQVDVSTEIIADVYYNTRRVRLAEFTIDCLNDDGDWNAYGGAISDSHFASVRTQVFWDTCRVRLIFLNGYGDRYADSSQKAAVRINVASTTGGFLLLTKPAIIVPPVVPAFNSGRMLSR